MGKRFYACIKFRNGEIIEECLANKIEAIIFCKTHYLLEGALFAGVYDDKRVKSVWEWNPNNDIIF